MVGFNSKLHQNFSLFSFKFKLKQNLVEYRKGRKVTLCCEAVKL